jgi:hypothetical protein
LSSDSSEERPAADLVFLGGILKRELVMAAKSYWDRSAVGVVHSDRYAQASVVTRSSCRQSGLMEKEVGV